MNGNESDSRKFEKLRYHAGVGKYRTESKLESCRMVDSCLMRTLEAGAEVGIVSRSVGCCEVVVLQSEKLNYSRAWWR